jgi:hypothetical protein
VAAAFYAFYAWWLSRNFNRRCVDMGCHWLVTTEDVLWQRHWLRVFPSNFSFSVCLFRSHPRRISLLSSHQHMFYYWWKTLRKTQITLHNKLHICIIQSGPWQHERGPLHKKNIWLVSAQSTGTAHDSRDFFFFRNRDNFFLAKW